MTRHLLQIPRTRAAATTVVLALLTILVAAIPGASGPPLRVLLDLLLVSSLLALAWAALVTSRSSYGTRRVVLTALATAAVFAGVGQGIASMQALPTGERAPFPSAADLMFVCGHITIMVGIVIALRRVRPMRFGAMVDAMLLVAAAVLLIVQLDYVPRDTSTLSTFARGLIIVWQVVCAATLILLAMLLAWRGERLGAATAVGFTAGTVLISIGSAWYLRMEMAQQGGQVAPAIALLGAAAASYVLALARTDRSGAGLTQERPRVESDAATIRAVAIVVAILIASISAAALGFGASNRQLAVTIGIFGALLALRTAYALWEQRRTTFALESSVVAEREMSATLEQRVTERTRELAEAQRALQRMWTLAQQIAMELDRSHVLDRFLEAIADVARADGAVVALYSEERLQAVGAHGIGAALRGTDLSPDSALRRVLRTGEPWWTENAHYEGPDLPSVPEVAIVPEVRGMAVVALQRRGERIGAVAILSQRQRRFTDQEIAHVEAMTDLLSLALANASLVESMRQTEWRFRTLFRAAPDAVLTVLESGRIREANEAVRELTGLEPTQIVGRSLEDLIAPEDRDRVRFEITETLAGAPARLEARFLNAGGARVVSLAARRLPQAEPPTVLLVGRDMTSEREMRVRLAETERLAAVGELVAGVAHEVNNPLCTISAFAQLMLRDASLVGEQRESVEVIQSETMRASQVLKDLLTFARRSEGARQAVDLNEVLQRTVRLRSYEMEQERIGLELTLADTLPPVDGDPGQLQQVALNLITNAVQAMKPRGGTLRITTRANAEHVLFEVADTGPGMGAEVRARIFEPFFTTKKEGTGLGLSVSYGIVTAHSGSIAVVRSGGSGTTFRVTLRRAKEHADDSEELGDVVVASERSPLRGMRILFVDDEPSLRSGMTAFARLRKIHVVTAGDGGSALSATRIGDFDAVVCDLRMPGMDGASFWEALRGERPALAARTLFITGDTVSPGSRAFLDATRQPVLTKPFEFERLEQMLGELVRVEAAVDA